VTRGTTSRGPTSLLPLGVVAALPFLLAHDGAGATWQALLVVLSLGLVVVVVLALVGRVRLEQPDDLVLPLASVAIASSLAPLGSAWLSDWVGWAFPIGVVMLVTTLLVTLTPLQLGTTEPVTYGAFALAVIGAALLYQPITLAWHPPVEFLPLAEDVEVAIVDPDEGAEVATGEVLVTVDVAGGSVGDELVAIDEIGPDAEEGGLLAVAVNGEAVEPSFDEDCSRRAACTTVTFPVEVDAGPNDVTVEFRRADGASFTPLVTDRVTVEAS
jgi:hypothetical protein